MNGSSIVMYTSEDGTTNLDVKLVEDPEWLTRQQMADLFGRDVKTIGKHINNALKEGLEGEVVVAKFATHTRHGAIEGKMQISYTEHYNLEMIT